MEGFEAARSCLGATRAYARESVGAKGLRSCLDARCRAVELPEIEAGDRGQIATGGMSTATSRFHQWRSAEPGSLPGIEACRRWKLLGSSFGKLFGGSSQAIITTRRPDINC